MSDDLKKEFWDRMADVRTGMLSATGARSVPMTHYIDEDDRAPVLWFITAKGTDLAKSGESRAAAEYIVSSDEKSIYARIDGHLSAVTNPTELDKLWNAIAGAWFEDGKQDPDVQLIRLDLTEAEVWATDGGAKFLYEVGKAHVTGDKPDMGDHGTIRF